MPTENTGSYPRIGDSLKQQRLRRAIADLEVKKIDEAGLRAVQDDVAREVIREQEKAGLDVVTDGHVRWYDPVSHWIGQLKGVRITGLLRFFDNNFYFRQPVVETDLEKSAPATSLVREFQFARSTAKRPVKVVLTGPYTLARLSQNNFYADFDDFLSALTKVFAQEVRALARAGVKHLQVDEPSLLESPKDFARFRKSQIPWMGAAGSIHKQLFFYFGALDGLCAKLLDLPVEAIGVDLVSHPGNLQSVSRSKWPAGKRLVAGVVDGRNTKLENAPQVAQAVRRLQKRIGASVTVAPSSGLEFLPRSSAYQKLLRCVQIAKRSAS